VFPIAHVNKTRERPFCSILSCRCRFLTVNYGRRPPPHAIALKEPVPRGWKNVFLRTPHCACEVLNWVLPGLRFIPNKFGPVRVATMRPLSIRLEAGKHSQKGSGHSELPVADPDNRGRELTQCDLNEPQLTVPHHVRRSAWHRCTAHGSARYRPARERSAQ
jgi:hypothetical protein